MGEGWVSWGTGRCPVGRSFEKLLYRRRNIVESSVERVIVERVARGGFSTPSVSTTNAADPVPVSDIKWSRACKLSHSAAEAPILAAAHQKQPPH